MRLNLAIALLVAGVPVAAHGQGTIVMKASVRLAADAPVTVADVATLMGPDAQALAGVVVVPAAERSDGRESVHADRVRAALQHHDRPVNWGRLTLAGGNCVVMPALAASQTPAHAAPAALPPERGTVRAVLADRIAMLVGASADDLKIEFDPTDGEFLGLTVAGRTVDARPTGLSDRLPLAVTVYETTAGVAGKIVAARTVRVGVRVRRSVVLAAASKRRGELIGPGDVTTEARWVSPADRPAPLDRIVGAAVKTRLTPGDEVRAGDVQPPLVVGRGDLVSVHCLSGQIVVRTTARAMADARDGEVVRLQSLTDEDRVFYGRMDGRGRAVAVSSAGDHSTGSRP